MTFWRLSTLSLGFCLGLAAANGEAQSQFRQDFICSSGASTRTVSLISVGSSDRRQRGACRVDYTKDGITRTVYSSGTSHAYCAKQVTVLVTKLAEAHYACHAETREQPDDVGTDREGFSRP